MESPLGMFIVCDGMGGHQFGEVASALAIAAAVEYVREHLTGATDKLALLADAAREANKRVIEEGARNRKRKGMGSTLVAMIHDGDRMGVVHVGDSRCYLFREGRIKRLTRDHSLIEELAGDDPQALAALGGYSNVITRAIGTAPDTQPDAKYEDIRPGDVFLLCSDGLSGVVKDAEIARVLARVEDLDACCVELVKLANENGGPDNISTVLVRAEA
ncbi:MAG: serine/threonine-protein phosphatase [Myxococcales bacterium]|nr:serine/threonine-protein phosphatase [Myxococcales bacterium]